MFTDSETGGLPQLLIRADAGLRVGAGHALRCLALADEWAARGGTARFLTRCALPNIGEQLARHALSPLLDVHPGPGDIAALRTELERRPSCLVIDGYGFDADYQRAAGADALATLVVDDIAHRGQYAADLLLNQNIAADAGMYAGRTEAELLLGLPFVLLRREFVEHPPEVPEPADTPRVLVTLGGGDVSEALLEVVAGLLAAAEPFCAKVITRAPLPALAALADGDARVECIEPTSEMPALIGWADLAITAGGTTCWELCHLGVPGLVLAIADNQRGNVAGLEAASVFDALPSPGHGLTSAVTAKLSHLLAETELRQERAARARELVDGRGPARVADALLRAALSSK